MLPAYQKSRNLGHRKTQGLLTNHVIIQEKIDGSQISFGIIDGELFVRSRGGLRSLDEEDTTFTKGIQQIRDREHLLTPGLIYRGEYLRKRRQNVLTYDRVPEGNIVLFDVCDIDEVNMSLSHLEGLGFDVCPVLFEGVVKDREQLDELVARESFLGGESEGIVIKDREKYIMAKLVADDFKEKHTGKKGAPPQSVQGLIETYATEARWNKAVQHLGEEDQLVGEPRDIGLLVKEVQNDVFEEHEEEIKDALFDYYGRQIKKGIVSGLAPWYLDRIAVDPFEEESS